MSGTRIGACLRWAGMGLALLILGLGALFHSNVPQEARPSTRKKVRAPLPPAELEASEAVPAREIELLAPASSEGEVAQAMDQSELRYQLQRLKVAAASGDATTVGSIQETLRRYGKKADPVLREEIREATDPLVREILITTGSLLR